MLAGDGGCWLLLVNAAPLVGLTASRSSLYLPELGKRPSLNSDRISCPTNQNTEGES